MKLENFTLSIKDSLKSYLKVALIPALFAFISLNAYGQTCPLGCNNNVQVSLDADCSVTITPDIILEGQGTDASCTYVVTVTTQNDVPIPNSPVVDGTYIGQTLKVRISLGANSCWGTISIEDKLPPVITCAADVTVTCYDNATPVLPVVTDNCDSNPTLITISDVTTDLDCSNTYSASRTVTYMAEDASGNQSGMCSTTIFYSRIGLGDITFPENRDNVEDRAFLCDNRQGDASSTDPNLDVINTPWDTNGDGYPQPSESGVPVTTVDGFPIFPNNSLCELNATFSDQVLPICDTSFKVLRNWTILDWCTGAIAQDFQIIKIINPQLIVTTDPGHYTGSVNPYTCDGSFTFPASDLKVNGTCDGTTYTYEVEYLSSGVIPTDVNNDGTIDGADCPSVFPGVFTALSGSFSSTQDATVSGLSLGCNWVRITVTTECGESETTTVEVYLEDTVPPTPVCDEFTAVTLTSNGWAHIFAETFDDGSHDNCSEVTFGVRRMSASCFGGGPNPPLFANINGVRYYEFEKFCCADVGSAVMVELLVMDASGNVNTCMVEVNVQDKTNPVLVGCPANVTVDCEADTSVGTLGAPTASDNCSANLSMTESTNIDNCGVGTIRRTWTATDAGGRTATCSQTITITNQSPFTGSQIRWPSDRDNLIGCMMVDTDPSTTGEPTFIGNQNCAQLAFTYTDQTFTAVPDACLKILRTWTVLDWCQFDQANPTGDGIWQYTQIIKINNSTAPVFDNCTNQSIPSFSSSCDGDVDFTITATDECTPSEDLVYTYRVYNGSSLVASGNTNRINRSFDILNNGSTTYRVDWTVEDLCGNLNSCSMNITLNDAKKPTPYCLSGITTVVMPSSGMISIWANDFNLNDGSFDNCTAKEDLRFTFTSTPPNQDPNYSSSLQSSSMSFDCNDLGVNLIRMYVWDERGNFDFCEVNISIQDNSGGCGNSSGTVQISGLVENEDNESINDVEVMLENMSTYTQTYFNTTSAGNFNFQGLNSGQDYEVSAVKDIDYMNGVSTLDLVLIQKHILGITQLNSAYKVIAADINGSESISAIDLIELRKLILGIYNELPDNDSWRFIDASQPFPQASNPWPLDEKISFFALTNGNSSSDFMGVKIGDVNGSSTPNLVAPSVETRSTDKLTLEVQNVEFVKGEQVELAITANNFTDIVGLQYTLSYDESSLEYVGVKAGSLNVTNDHVGASYSQRGLITTSWNDIAGVVANDDQTLYTLSFRAKTNGTLANTIYGLSSELLNTEAYNEALEVMDLNMIINNTNDVASSFSLGQNTPNPFDNNTSIAFTLPSDMKATFTIYDLAGKVLFTNTDTYSKGLNTLAITQDDINTASGVLYYRIEAGEFSQTKKMIVLNK